MEGAKTYDPPKVAQSNLPKEDQEQNNVDERSSDDGLSTSDLQGGVKTVEALFGQNAR